MWIILNGSFIRGGYLVSDENEDFWISFAWDVCKTVWMLLYKRNNGTECVDFCRENEWLTHLGFI